MLHDLSWRMASRLHRTSGTLGATAKMFLGFFLTFLAIFWLGTLVSWLLSGRAKASVESIQAASAYTGFAGSFFFWLSVRRKLSLLSEDAPTE